MATVEKVSVALTTSLLEPIRKAVDSGEYASSSEVVREAIREWTAKRDVQRHELQALRADIAQGIADIAAGRLTNFDERSIIERGRALLGKNTLSG